MGQYLSSPVTDKVTESGGFGVVEYGLAAQQGWRRSMEDAHVIAVLGRVSGSAVGECGEGRKKRERCGAGPAGGPGGSDRSSGDSPHGSDSSDDSLSTDTPHSSDKDAQSSSEGEGAGEGRASEEGEGKGEGEDKRGVDGGVDGSAIGSGCVLSTLDAVVVLSGDSGSSGSLSSGSGLSARSCPPPVPASLPPASSPYGVSHAPFLLGIFDGHGGAEVARFCARRFAHELAGSPEFRRGEVARSLVVAFHRMDELIRSPDGAAQVGELREEGRLGRIARAGGTLPPPGGLGGVGAIDGERAGRSTAATAATAPVGAVAGRAVGVPAAAGGRARPRLGAGLEASQWGSAGSPGPGASLLSALGARPAHPLGARSLGPRRPDGAGGASPNEATLERTESERTATAPKDQAAASAAGAVAAAPSPLAPPASSKDASAASSASPTASAAAASAAAASSPAAPRSLSGASLASALGLALTSASHASSSSSPSSSSPAPRPGLASLLAASSASSASPASGPAPGAQAGCTAVVALVLGRRLYVANAGDSRAVLCRGGGSAVPLSFDHRPATASERERIVSAGGFVTEVAGVTRVNGNLNLSRAIGDLRYKDNASLPASRQIITAEPDVTEVDLRDDDRFLVVACDGIWDVLTSQHVCSFVAARLDAGDSPERAAEALLDACISRDPRESRGIGCDNMTAAVVLLGNEAIRSRHIREHTKNE